MTAPAVWVTGGASGIGAELVRRLCGQGRTVFVADAAPLPVGSPAAGGDLLDVRDADALQRSCLKAAQTPAGLGLAVLCAGIGGTGPGSWDTVDVNAYKRIVDVNITGVVQSIAAAVPHVRRTRGAIVVLASLAGLTPFPDNPFYAMTKAAVVGLVRSLGPDLERDGVRIAAVCPGFVDTPLIDSWRSEFAAADLPLLDAGTVVDAVLRAANEGDSGSCWLVQPGHEPSPYRFRGVPGAARADGTVAAVPSLSS